MKTWIYLGMTLLIRSQATYANFKSLHSEGPQNPSSELRIFGGFGLGYSDLHPQFSSDSLRGQQLNVMGLASFRKSRLTLDTGAGWFYNQISGKLGVNQQLEFKTRAGYIEFAPHYSIAENWHLGAVVDWAFGTDLSFRRGTGPNSSVILGGLQALCELPADTAPLPIRFFARAVTNATLSESRFSYLMLGLQFGIPLFNADPITPKHLELTQSDETLSDQSVSWISPVQAPQGVQVEISAEAIHFETASAQLPPRASQFLRQLGTFLQSENDWSTLEVNGHTDERGPFDYNLQLSRRRAGSVAQDLARGGVPQPKLDLKRL